MGAPGTDSVSNACSCDASTAYCRLSSSSGCCMAAPDAVSHAAQTRSWHGRITGDLSRQPASAVHGMLCVVQLSREHSKSKVRRCGVEGAGHLGPSLTPFVALLANGALL